MTQTNYSELTDEELDEKIEANVKSTATLLVEIPDLTTQALSEFVAGLANLSEEEKQKQAADFFQKLGKFFSRESFDTLRS